MPPWAFSGGKEFFTCQCRRYKRRRFDPWVRKISWSRKSQPTPIFLPGKFMDGGAWWATVHGVTRSQTREKEHEHRCPPTLGYCYLHTLFLLPGLSSQSWLEHMIILFLPNTFMFPLTYWIKSEGLRWEWHSKSSKITQEYLCSVRTLQQ